MELYKDVTVYSRLLVEHEHVCATLEECVSGGKTCETATDDDDLCHCALKVCAGVVGVCVE